MAVPRSSPPLARSLAALIPAVAIALLGACASDERVAPTISAEELAARIEAGQAPLILDVRTEQEFASGHIPGARNVPHDALADRLSELGVTKDEEIVVHCQSGGRARVAEQVLRDAGYTGARDLDGHWRGWQEAGLPSE